MLIINMSSLQNVTLNSINAIEERLRALQEEVKDIEEVYGDVQNLEPEPLPMKPPKRYQELPEVDLAPAPRPQVKPQITAEYTRTLQFVPDVMSHYKLDTQEPQFIEDIQILPPRINTDQDTLTCYISQQTDLL